MPQDKGQSNRIARVEREVREIVAGLLSSQLKGLTDSLITVSRVWVSKDLRIARVYVSVLAPNVQDEASQKVATKEALDALDESRSEIQSEVAHQLKIRYTPKIEFFYDDSLDESLRVQSLIRNLEQERIEKEKANKPSSEDE